MKTLNRIVQRFFWKPAGYIPSLESLEESHGVVSKRDVTMAVSGLKGGHPLMVVELIDGKIIGNLRMVAAAEDVVIGGLQSLFGCAEPQKHYLLRRRRFRMLKYRSGTALLLGESNSDNYYHWMLDSVPRWKMLQAANWSNYDFVLLQSRPSRFQDEVLDRLNVPNAKRLRCSKNLVHQFERLVVPETPLGEGVLPWTCAYVRSLFPEKMSGPKKIYLYRGAGRRRLVNEMELETALAKIGFVSIKPERLTVAEQAKFLSSARCVVAPHGAALTNLLFAPRGALLLELFHPQHKTQNYPGLAIACGHRYASLDGHTINTGDNRKLEYVVDIPAVLQAIAENS